MFEDVRRESNMIEENQESFLQFMKSLILGNI